MTRAGAPAPRSELIELSRLAVPLMGTMLAMVASFVATGIMVSRIDDGGVSLTALGFAVQLWFLLMVGYEAFAGGTVAVISRAHGAGDKARVVRLLGQCAQTALFFGLAFALAGALLAEPILRLMGATPDVADAGASYLRMLMLGFPFAFVSEGALGPAMRAVGNSRIQFVCSVIGHVLGLVLAYVLIFGAFGVPALGILGAGLAIAISRALELALVIFAMRWRLPDLAIPRPAPIDRTITKDVFHVALPTVIEQLTFHVAMIAFVSIVGHVAEPAVAAHGIGARLANFLLVPGFGTSMAIGALVGNALGAGDVVRAKRVLRAGTLAITALTGVIAIATYAALPWITAAYDLPPGSAIADYTRTWVTIVACTGVLQGIMLAFEGLLLGAGASRTIMKINLSTTLCIQLPVAAVMGYATDLGPLGVWLAWPITIAVQIPLAVVAYRREGWAVTGTSVAAAS